VERTCKRCGVTRPVEEFVINRSASSGGNICRPCRRKRDAERREAERQRFRDEHKAWREANREHVRAYARRRAAELRRAILDAYGPDCACCGESEPAFLTLDHIDGGGTQHRKSIHGKVYDQLRRQGFPSGYRVLCWNCNWAYRLGDCPHRAAG
jgi:hypothetical protein